MTKILMFWLNDIVTLNIQNYNILAHERCNLTFSLCSIANSINLDLNIKKCNVFHAHLEIAFFSNAFLPGQNFVT